MTWSADLPPQFWRGEDVRVVPGGEPHRCVQSAERYVAEHPGSRYAESWVRRDGARGPHAWAVDEDGRVVDVTLPEQLVSEEYVSKIFPPDWQSGE